MTSDYIPLTKAIKLIRQKYTWLSENSLRDAIREGRIPCKRSSNLPKAHVFVRMVELENYVAQL